MTGEGAGRAAGQAWVDFQPIRGVADIAALEAVPLNQRITCWDINTWLKRGCLAQPEKPAVTYYPAGNPADVPHTLSYRELDARATQVANLFHQMGVRAGDTVMLLAPTLPDTYSVVLGGMARGIICCVNWMLDPDHLVDLVRASGAKVLVALGPTTGYAIWEGTQAIRDRLPPGTRILSLAMPGGAVLPETDLMSQAAAQPAEALLFDSARQADDVVAYVHSGGTTGAPKLVKLTSRGIVHKCWTVVTTMAHRSDDILFSDMPMFHVAGLVSCALIPVVMSSSLVIPTPMGARDKVFIGNFWKFVEQCRVTFLHAVPTTLGTLAQNPPTTEDISSLRDYATTGSTALPVDVARTIEANLGIRLLMTYGATEFTQNVTQAPRDGDPRYGCAGIRNPYTEIRIVKLDGNGRIERDCDADEIGSVIVRSPGNTPGYVDPRHDGEIFLADGWINNGDLGRLDPQGYLWLTGRAKDLIIRGGHNIDPVVIEDALRRHPSVAMVGAVGQPDAYAGELPVAYVQLREGTTATEAELIRFAETHISERAAVPKAIHIIAEMPLTDVRKLAKAELRKDAIKRVFGTVLGSALGEHVDIAVMPHDVHGIAVNITLPATAPERRVEIERLVDEAVRGYSIRAFVHWS